jgi:hypothetical protein
MRAGVRPGLQILWILLSGIGRFDSDTLPPDSPGRTGRSKEESTCHVTRCSPLEYSYLGRGAAGGEVH